MTSNLYSAYGGYLALVAGSPIGWGLIVGSAGISIFNHMLYTSSETLDRVFKENLEKILFSDGILLDRLPFYLK